MRIDSNVMVYMRRVCNGGALDIYGQYPIWQFFVVQLASGVIRNATKYVCEILSFVYSGWTQNVIETAVIFCKRPRQENATRNVSLDLTI